MTQFQNTRVQSSQVLVEVEPFFEVFPEIKELMVYHWLEVTDDISRELSLDENLFRTLDEAGRVVCVSARHNGSLVGYIVFFVFRPPHYDIEVAADDAHYVRPEYRSWPLFKRMVEKAEEVLKMMGVDVVRYHTKIRDGLDRTKVFGRLGYKPEETIVTKNLRS